MLWRIEYFVEGKNLEKALAGAAGIALNMSTPQPVSGAMVTKQGSKKQVKGADAPIEGSYKEQFIEWLKAKDDNERVSSQQMKKYFTDTLGASKNSFNNFLMKAIIDEGYVKRIARGQYVITK